MKSLFAKIIVLSADVQKIIKAELKDLGVLAFINKPLNPETTAQMISIIKEHCHA